MTLIVDVYLFFVSPKLVKNDNPTKIFALFSSKAFDFGKYKIGNKPAEFQGVCSLKFFQKIFRATLLIMSAMGKTAKLKFVNVQSYMLAAYYMT